MIATVKDIVTPEPEKHIWKLLRYHLDEKSVCEFIRQTHEIPKGKYDSDVSKQARQIGYCIRQAEEYFTSSATVTLATKPVLLYYGAVSLSQALILLKKDGTYSLDATQATGRHRHHGLEPVGWDSIRGTSMSHQDFFGSIRCRCHTKTESSDGAGDQKVTPWGQFAVFYGALAPSACLYLIEMVDTRQEATLIRTRKPLNCADIHPIEEIIPETLDVLSLIRSLPEMYPFLIEVGIRPDLCRLSVKAGVRHVFAEEDDGSWTETETQERHDFYVDNILDEQKRSLLELYRTKIPQISVEADFPNHLRLRLVHVRKPEDNAGITYYPDMVDDCQGQKYLIVDPSSYLPEPAAYFAILYCIGMLSRYYPHVWVKVVDSNVMVAELTESLLSAAYRRFPNLILDQLTNTKNFIHPFVQ